MAYTYKKDILKIKFNGLKKKQNISQVLGKKQVSVFNNNQKGYRYFNKKKQKLF